MEAFVISKESIVLARNEPEAFGWHRVVWTVRDPTASTAHMARVIRALKNFDHRTALTPCKIDVRMVTLDDRSVRTVWQVSTYAVVFDR